MSDRIGTTKKWLDKYNILSEDDIPGLDAIAASNEFRRGLERTLAESEAYNAYLREHASKAMAFHLTGARLANLLNDDETALRHGSAYEAAARASGYGIDKVPPEVLKEMAGCKSMYTFKPHPADTFFTPQEVINQPVDPHPDNAKMAQIVDGLRKLSQLLDDGGKTV